MGAEFVLHPIEIVDEIPAFFGCVLQEGIEIVMIHLASQAEREGSIPSTRSSKPHKALRPILAVLKSLGFTYGFTPSVPVAFYARWHFPPNFGLPEYPVGIVDGPCVCGSWPGGECLHCAVLTV